MLWLRVCQNGMEYSYLQICYNDLDMLQHAAVGIAVANAVDDVKEEADFVTEKNNNQDAVAEIITKMLNHDYDIVVEKCNE